MNPSTEEAGLCGLQIQGEARLHKEILAQQIHKLVFRRAGERLESNELVSWVYKYIKTDCTYLYTTYFIRCI